MCARMGGRIDRKISCVRPTAKATLGRHPGAVVKRYANRLFKKKNADLLHVPKKNNSVPLEVRAMEQMNPN